MRVLRLVLAAGLVLGLAAPAAAVGTGYEAVVRRTEYGIPHVLAKDIGSAGYGYGHAFAQDNPCALEEIMLTANGDRSRWFGPDADAGDLNYGPMTNLDSDTFVRSVLDNGFLRQVMDQPAPLGLDAQTCQLIDGYVAGVAGGDGAALLANPHFPWLGGDRLCQVQLTVPGVMNVSGASIYGTPFVVIGHTAHLAWTHTVSTAQRFTLYELRLVPGDPTSYLVDGRPEKMTETDVTVPTGSKPLSPKRFTVRDTGRCWPTAGPRRAAYFADASVVPHVTDEQAARCVDTPEAKALYPAEIELDGSTSDCAWGSARDAVAPGIFGPSRYPTPTRTDFVTNSNDSSWLTNPAAPITALPAIYGPVGTKRLARTQLGLEQIQQQLPSRFTLANLQELLTHERNWSADRGRDAVVSLCRAESVLTLSNGTPVDVPKACAALAAWSRRDGVDDRGAVLWREFWLRASKVPDLWSVPFDPGRPVDTPNTVNIARNSVRQALADAVLRLSQLGVPVDAPLSAAQYTTVGGGVQPVPGCGNVEGCHDITAATDSGLLRDDGRFGAVTLGSGFVMAVRLTSDGPVARTLLTYSESTDAASPHHGDQTALHGSGKWVVDRFREADIVADPQLSLSVLCGRGA